MNRIPMLIILALVIGGGVYGYFSGVHNSNPYNLPVDQFDRVSREEAAAAKAWRPSPVWLPSYLVATVYRYSKPIERGPAKGTTISVVGYGMTNIDGAGYTFGNSLQRSKYQFASAAVGGLMGLVISVIILLASGMVRLRSPKEAPPAAKKPVTTFP